MPTDEERTPAFAQRSMGRRAVIRGGGLGVAGLAAAALIGCGGDDDDDPPAEGTASSGGDGAALKTTDPRPDQLPEGWVWDSEAPFPTDFPEPAGKTPKPGGVFRVAASWDVGPFDPVAAAAGGSLVVPNLVYNRLVGFPVGPGVDKSKLELEPELASSWERTPDGLSVTFKIAPGVKWQNVDPLNGRDFVAADAKFAFERYQTDGVYKSYWTNVESIDAVDASTLRITLTKPVVDFIYPLAGRYQTIFPKELVDSGSIGQTAVGTGPLILREAITGQRVTVDKNPDYWETDILLDGMEFRPMPDASARLAALRAGQVEYSYIVVGTKRDVDQLLQSNPDMQVTSILGSNSAGAVPLINHQNPKWQDVRVRRALSLGIDREAISQLIFEGLGRTLSVLPWFYVLDEAPTIESGNLGNWVRYAPDEAKQLLDAAGYADMTVDAPYYEYGISYTQRAEIITDQLRQIGVTYRASKMDYTEYNSQLIGGTFPDALSWGYLPLGFEADTYFFNAVHSQSPGNRDHMSDPDIDTWSEAQQTELDADARKELHRKIWDKYNDGVFRPMATNGRAFEVLQPWVRGFRFGGALGTGSSFYDWGELMHNAWLDK